MLGGVWLLWIALSADAGAVTLEEAQRAAEERNVDLGLARTQTTSVQSLRGQAWTLVSPKIVAQAAYTWNQYEIALDFSEQIPEEFQSFFEDSEPIVVQPKRYAQASLTIQQPLFSGTALPALLGAYAMSDAATHDEAWARAQLHAGVARAYYGVYTAREAVRLAEEALRTTESARDLVRRQVDAGLAPPRLSLQAELDVSRARRQLEQARAAREVAERAFANATGLDPAAPVELPAPPTLPESVEAAVEAARARRPDILAAERQHDAARWQQRANWSGWLPTVNGRFTEVYTENTGFSEHDTFWVAAVEAEWLLWDGGWRVAKAREAGAQARAAELLVERRVLDADLHVRSAWATLQEAEAALVATEREVALAEENARLARLGFEAGSATFLEVEQAELGLHAARLDGVTARMNRDLAAIDVRVAMGRYGPEPG